jgi:hypothetical protein
MSQETTMTDDDDFDGVQYDTFHAPSSQQLEADDIRRECYADQRGHDVTWMTAEEIAFMHVAQARFGG